MKLVVEQEPSVEPHRTWPPVARRHSRALLAMVLQAAQEEMEEAAPQRELVRAAVEVSMRSFEASHAREPGARFRYLEDCRTAVESVSDLLQQNQEAGRLSAGSAAELRRLCESTVSAVDLTLQAG